jgi:hypothetical protein
VIHGKRHLFGVSGRLYKLNLLLYDHETDSLWSQLLSQAVTGPLTGARLAALPCENTTWQAWKSEHPQTLVLSFQTGYAFDYRQDPYRDYPLVRFPALLVSATGISKIYSLQEIRLHWERSKSQLSDQVGGNRVTIVYDSRSNSAYVKSDTPGISTLQGFLNDLKAFHPEASVYTAPR